MTEVDLLRRIEALERRVYSVRRTSGYHASDWDTTQSRLWGALTSARFGGGQLLWTMPAQGRMNYGHGGTAWSDINIDATNYYSVIPAAANEYAGGGPYVTLNGADERLAIADASWQEAGTTSLFVWQWVWASSLSASMAIAAKWSTATDNRSWMLYCRLPVPAFQFMTNATGLAADNVGLFNSHAVTTDTWYFVAAYILPGTRQAIYVAADQDTEVTIDELAVGVPASLYDTTAGLTLGSTGTVDQYWEGRMGIGAGWLNVPNASADDYAQHLFCETRWAYPT